MLAPEVCVDCHTEISRRARANVWDGEAVLCSACYRKRKDKAKQEAARAKADAWATRTRSFYSKIAGVTQCNSDGTDRQRLIARCSPGEELILLREPTNRFDHNAVALLRRPGEQLGYLKAEVAEEIAPLLDRGITVSVVISNLTGGGWFSGKDRGVIIAISVQGTQ